MFPNTSLLLVVGHNSFQIFDHLVLWWRVIKNIVDEMLCYMYARSQETGSKRWELHIINKRSMKWWCKRWKVENHYWFIFFYLFFSFNSFCENSFIHLFQRCRVLRGLFLSYTKTLLVDSTWNLLCNCQCTCIEFLHFLFPLQL